MQPNHIWMYKELLKWAMLNIYIQRWNIHLRNTKYHSDSPWNSVLSVELNVLYFVARSYDYVLWIFFAICIPLHYASPFCIVDPWKGGYFCKLAVKPSLPITNCKLFEAGTVFLSTKKKKGAFGASHCRSICHTKSYLNQLRFIYSWFWKGFYHSKPCSFIQMVVSSNPTYTHTSASLKGQTNPYVARNLCDQRSFLISFPDLNRDENQLFFSSWIISLDVSSGWQPGMRKANLSGKVKVQNYFLHTLS